MKPDATSADFSRSATPTPGLRQRRGALALLTVGAAVVLGVWWSSASSPRSGSTARVVSGRDRVQGAGSAASSGSARDYVGSRACAECHPGESALHDNHGHSRTLRRFEASAIASWLETQSALDPEFRSARWTYRLDDDRKTMLAFLHLGGETTSRPLEYIFGSGDHAATFVSLASNRKGSEAFEHRMTYFAHSRGLGVTPGQHMGGDAHELVTPEGRRLNPGSARRCFGCHTTRLSDQDQSVFDPTTMIPTVGCEACHGPGRAHIEAAKRDPLGEWSDALAMPWGSSRSATAAFAPEEEMKLCGRCHRHPSMAPTGAIRPDNPELARFQPAAMMQSLCYQRGQLRCVTCHDPHAQPSRDHADYDNRCLSCHQGGDERRAGGTVCTIQPAPSSGCVDCHMPKKNAGQDILFADHWIRKPDPKPKSVELHHKE